MKKLLFSLSLVGVLAAFAGESEIDASAQIFGVLPITSSAENVIVSVPWVAASNTETNLISVTEIIKTANLTAGDWIRVWPQGTTNNKFKVWNLVNSGGVLVWEAGTVVDANGSASSGSSSDTYLKRGDAIILHRQNTTGDNATFYVYGQYNSSSAGSTECALGTTSIPAYTLIAPPGTTDVDVNEGIEWSNVGTYDQLVFSDGTMPTYNSGWGSKQSYYDETKKVYAWKWSALTKNIPAGTGIWYVNRGGNAKPCATWK